MTTTPFTETLTVRGPDSLPALVPHLCGFVPTNSLVLLGMEGDRGRVRVTMRADLPDPSRPISDCCDDLRRLVPALPRGGADAAILVLYPGADEDPWSQGAAQPLPRRDLVVELEAVLDEVGVPLRDAVCVVGDRLGSYLCDDPGCCPPEGRTADYSERLRVQAAFVDAGSAPLQSREELESSLDPRDEDDPLREEVDAVRTLLADCEPFLSVADVDSFLVGLDEWRSPSSRADLLPGLAALGTALCQRIRPRDLLLRALTVDADRDTLQHTREVLHESVRCAPAAMTAPVASVLAVTAWLQGDGACARVALERALACDPDYSLAHLVITALDQGMPPWEWAKSMRGLSVDDILVATAADYRVVERRSGPCTAGITAAEGDSDDDCRCGACSDRV